MTLVIPGKSGIHGRIEAASKEHWTAPRGLTNSLDYDKEVAGMNTTQSLRICSLEDCTGEVKARGFCNKHYERFRKAGTTDRPPNYQVANTDPCRVDGCERPPTRRLAWCEMHYYRNRRDGSAGERAPRVFRPISKEDTLWERVEVTGFCWNWTGYLNRAGYGRFMHEGRMQLSHRVSYETLVASIPEGLVIDHLCRNPRCVNPDHLEPVTKAENTRRGLLGVLGHTHDMEPKTTNGEGR